MSIDLGGWLGNHGGLPLTQWGMRAEIQWAHIQDKPTDVEFVKPKVVTKSGVTAATALPTQTVRIEFDSRATLARGQAGAAPMLQATIFGVQGHPDIDDTDIDEGYTFEFEGDSFRVTDVIRVIGGVQARAIVNG